MSLCDSTFSDTFGRLDSRSALASLATGLAQAARRDRSSGGARVRCGHTGAFYGQTGMELEGWSRPLWAIVPLVAGGTAVSDSEALASALDHGTDPGHPEFWGWPGEGDPRFVEMASIAFAIRMVPQIIWDPLSLPAKNRAATWLNEINRHRLPDCNWLFFRVMTNHALKSVGAPHDHSQAMCDLDRLEEMSVGGGWYADGPAGTCDHYNGLAFHFYGLLYSAWARDHDPERCQRFRQRASEFAEDFIHWFDPNGAAVPYGRSLTYRFAMAAFWAAAAWADLPVFTPGVLRGLVMRNLRWWFAQPILDPLHRLTIGYIYPNLLMAEIYNSPASPGWAFKTLLPLALPESHPFWIADEEPLPAMATHRLMAGGRLLLQHAADGHTMLLTNGQNWNWDGGNYAAKYARFAYSSRFAFSVPHGDSPLEAACPDSTLLVSTDGARWFGRTHTEDHSAGPDWVESTWSPCEGVRIRTRLTALHDGHERFHEIENDQEIQVVEGGFALPRGPEPLATLTRNPSPGVAAQFAQGHALWSVDGSSCEIRDLPEDGVPVRTGRLLENWPNTSLCFPSTVTPILEARLSPGRHALRCRIILAQV